MPRKQPIKWSNYTLLEKSRLAEAFDSDFMQDFFDIQESELFEKWKKETTEDKRHQLWLQCQGIAAFRKFVEDTIALGNMANAEITKKKLEEGESNR